MVMCDYTTRAAKAFLWCLSLCVGCSVLASPADVVINEIMYNPPDDAWGYELEFVELYNRGAGKVDISGWRFSDGISFAFPAGTVMESDGYLVVCSDPVKMVSRYGIYNVIGPFSGRLDNQGERVALSDGSAVPVLIDEVEYGTGGNWPSEPDGNGPSLELVNPWADNSIGGNWRASQPRLGRGTPGSANSCYQGNPPPAVMDVMRSPVSPTSTQTVSITARVTDESAVQTVRLYYDSGSGTQQLAMADLGGGVYSATIPAQWNGTWVWYSIAATDDSLAVGWWPIGAPEKKAWYRVDNAPTREGEVVINEVMYHNTVEIGEDLEWVEIFNTTKRVIDLSLWCLKDDEDWHCFYIPMGTTLPGGGFLVISRDAVRTMELYGISNVVGDFTFRFSDGGSLVRLFDCNGALIDLVEYGDSSPWPDEADGNGASLECANPFSDNSLFSNWGPGLPAGTPGLANSIYSPFNHDADIVINEIMYHPANDNDNVQFTELFNRGAEAVDLSSWQFTRGITHTFSAGTQIPPGGFLVLCKDAYEAQKLYGFGGAAISWQMGRLDHGGETLALENSVGTTVDIVKYDDDPPWPVAADGYGSSLECINPYADNNHPRNWRASSGEAYWQFVQRQGTATSSLLCFYMLEPGECLIDDISITDLGGTYNYVPNGGLESDEAGWQKTGNHSWSYREIGRGHSGNACMHIVATDTGSTLSNFVGISTVPPLEKNQTCVLSFWVKHFKGGTRLYSCTSGGGLGGQTVLGGSGLLSSPGNPNTVFSLDLPPFISRAEHLPSMPKPNEAARIVAEVEDDVQVGAVILQYKSALEKTWVNVEMRDDGLNGDALAGDGLYTAITATYPSQTVVQYTVTAIDNLGNTTNSPAQNDPKPNHAYFVYDREVVSKLPVYFMSIPNMASMDPYTDNYYPATFVYEGKVYENVGVRYRGQTSRAYKKKCLKVRFNDGDLFTGSFDDELRSIDLQAMWADKSYLREKLSNDMFKKVKVAPGVDKWVAYCETRHVVLYINGQYWGLFLEMEAPGRRFLKRNKRDDTGNLYKAYNEATDIWGFEKKTNEETTSMADLSSFLWGVNNTPETQITDFLNTRTDIDSQIAYNAVNSVINNSDQPAKNYFLYHDPVSDKWEMFPWDLDLTYGRNYELSGGVCNDVIRWNNHIFFGTRIHPKNDGPWNRIIDRFFYPENSPYTAPFRQKMIDKTREVLDNYFTPRLQYEEIDSLVELIKEEAARDRAKWGSYSSIDTDLQSQVSILKGFITSRRSYLYTNFLTDKNAPIKPRNMYPRDGDYAVFPTAVLRPGSYSDPNGNAHAASQWQVREEGKYWTEPVLDEVSEKDLISYEVPAEVLEPLKVYYWRVRFKDSTGVWGNWSDETSFAIGLDTDADGLCDSVETNTGVYVTPTNTGTNPRNPDSDGDGLTDGEEVLLFQTNPNIADTDGDGLTDWEEIKIHLTDPRAADTDGDSLPDAWEVVNLLNPKDATGPNGAAGDPDGDGLMNVFELHQGTSPNDPDTDGDGMDDCWELEHDFSPIDPSGPNGPDADADGDGLSNLDEYRNRTNPNKSDTDEDGLGDLWEVQNKLDPNDPQGVNGPDGDPDMDGMTNLQEMVAGTDPRSPESFFAVSSVRVNNPGVAIRWRSVQGKKYRVYVADSLTGEWLPIGDEIVGTGEESTYVDEGADSAEVRFYKVLVQ